MSGNPGGKPKLIREFHDFLKDKAFPKAQAAILRCLDSADGKVAMMAVKEVNDRLFGKAPQAITGENGGPLQVSFAALFGKLQKAAGEDDDGGGESD